MSVASIPDPQRVLACSDCLVDTASVQQAIAAVAAAINRDWTGGSLRVLPLLNGALPFAGQLLPLLDMPLRVAALQVGRYGGAERGAELQWHMPLPAVAGEQVLLLDDVLDEGLTLAGVRAAVMAAGARECRVAVLAEKNPARPKPLRADYVGLALPDRFVFGMGMDAWGWWRNLPSIHAVREGELP